MKTETISGKIARLSLLIFIFTALSVNAEAQRLRMEVFRLLDLSKPGLEKVNQEYQNKNYKAAGEELLCYFRGRSGHGDEVCPVNSAASSRLSPKTIAQWAMEHTLFVHDGYLPPYNYGEQIDWQYWPVKDNELRWQLHRQKWFTPMGQEYRKTGDERYAIEWMSQFMDWIVKNPMDDSENASFAWRPLEVSHRLEDRINQFILFIGSPSMTPEFFTEFLTDYYRHAHFVMTHFSGGGNHLLFQAQRILGAGAFFPEFKESKKWRKAGTKILSREIEKQIYPDGVQFELCPHYHLACIDIFCKALQTARENGLSDAFSDSYRQAVGRMIDFYVNLCYPDGTNPYFSDARLTPRKELLPKYREWAGLFPENKYLQKLAGLPSGEVPCTLSRAFPDGGFFIFRNSWGDDALQMDVKAGPAGEWHNQPDNGTFELWYRGHRLFTDSGSYVYAGGEEVMQWRNLFRSSAFHNMVTLNGRDIESRTSRTLLWKPDGDVQILVTELDAYEGLRVRRSIFFVDGRYFVMADQAIGSATGVVNLNFQMPEGKIENSREDMHFSTEFADGSNFTLRCFGPDGMSLKKEKGWVSDSYLHKKNRMHISFNVKRDAPGETRFITVILPKETPGNDTPISACVISSDPASLSLKVKIGNSKNKTLSYQL